MSSNSRKLLREATIVGHRCAGTGFSTEFSTNCVEEHLIAWRSKRSQTITMLRASAKSSTISAVEKLPARQRSRQQHLLHIVKCMDKALARLDSPMDSKVAEGYLEHWQKRLSRLCTPSAKRNKISDLCKEIEGALVRLRALPLPQDKRLKIRIKRRKAIILLRKWAKTLCYELLSSY